MKKTLIIVTVFCLLLTMTGCVPSFLEKLADSAISIIAPKETDAVSTQVPSARTEKPAEPSKTEDPAASGSLPEDTFLPEQQGETEDPGEAEREYLEEASREAYAAYRAILCENWYDIQKYDWQKGHYGFGNWEVEEIPTPVAILDIAGDDVPELLFIAGDPQYEYMTHLYIYAYQDGEAVQIHDRIWDVLAGGGFYYTLFQVRGEKDLYAFYSTGDETWEDIIVQFRMNSAGTYLKAEDYLYKKVSPDYDAPAGTYETIKEYRIREAEVDEEEFEKESKRLMESVEKVILDTSQSDNLEQVPDAGVAYTLVDAVDWLSDQLPAREDFDFVWDCGQDGDDVQAMLDLQAGMLIIQGEGRMAEEENPWGAYATSIRHVVVCEGITRIENLSGLHALKDIYLPGSLKVFGRVSLGYCGVNYFGGKFDGLESYNPIFYYAGSEEDLEQVEDAADRGKGFLFGTTPEWVMETAFDWSQVKYKGIRQ